MVNELIVGAGWRIVLLLSPTHCGGSVAVYYISSFRRLAWPGLLGVGIFSETGKEFAEK